MCYLGHNLHKSSAFNRHQKTQKTLEHPILNFYLMQRVDIDKNIAILLFIGKPESPYNCTLSNQTTESLSVECSAGFDGGQPQHFLLELFDQHTGKLQASIISKENVAFTVHDLESGKVLNMALYAVNAKGRSDPTILEGFTLKAAEKQTGK